ncbi:LuxR C-terminal-related transcriptional regulator [Aquimarina gracilis]|uniref:LuxR C-terminal-related transcriptional regulator n=2 Tax=Aquimarina gracilis TaxID=874422 RepID=A0ABU5ZYI2_9FLAO|nr:LuxR C-terminal-related transcriptional regulator [Aquimarina gracilis]
MIMKFKYFLLVFLALLPSISFSQNAISGYANIENLGDWEQKIYLSQVNINSSGQQHTEIIASASLSENGFFSFDKKLLASKDRIYKIHINPLPAEEKEIISDKIKNYKLFILSKRDSIFFKKGITLFEDYTTNSTANNEWKKLKNFEAQYDLQSENFDPKQYLLETRGYVKDSLHILLVKLISIKKLDDQQLLETDIKANPKYYLDLLAELKSSDLDPKTYQYLESKLAFITQQITKRNYKVSLWFNGLAIVTILLLTVLIFRYRKNSKSRKNIELSKQEIAVKELIVSGKTNKEIANELFISLNTVKTHITNIYSKLNISSRRELQLKK